MYPRLGDTNIAYTQPAILRTPLQTYFNAPGLVTGTRTPITTVPRTPIAVAPLPTFTPRPIATPVTTKLPVLLPKSPLTVGTFGTPSAAPGSPSVNVSVSGGAGVSPSGTIATESAGMMGMLSDVNPTMLVFLGMAALVAFMESGKKGRR